MFWTLYVIAFCHIIIIIFFLLLPSPLPPLSSHNDGDGGDYCIVVMCAFLFYFCYAGSTFGTPGGTSLFGQQQQQQTGGLFGQQQKPGGLFGTSTSGVWDTRKYLLDVISVVQCLSPWPHERSLLFAIYCFWKWYSWEAYQKFWVQKCSHHYLLIFYSMMCIFSGTTTGFGTGGFGTGSTGLFGQSSAGQTVSCLGGPQSPPTQLQSTNLQGMCMAVRQQQCLNLYIWAYRFLRFWNLWLTFLSCNMATLRCSVFGLWCGWHEAKLPTKAPTFLSDNSDQYRGSKWRPIQSPMRPKWFD